MVRTHPPPSSSPTTSSTSSPPGAAEGFPEEVQVAEPDQEGPAAGGEGGVHVTWPDLPPDHLAPGLHYLLMPTPPHHLVTHLSPLVTCPPSPDHLSPVLPHLSFLT